MPRGFERRVGETFRSCVARYATGKGKEAAALEAFDKDVAQRTGPLWSSLGDEEVKALCESRVALEVLESIGALEWFDEGGEPLRGGWSP